MFAILGLVVQVLYIRLPSYCAKWCRSSEVELAQGNKGLEKPGVKINS